MTGLADHRIATRVSPRAIGHSAGFVNAVTITDPELDLTLCVFLNGVSLASADVEFARTALVDLVIRTVEARPPDA